MFMLGCGTHVNHSLRGTSLNISPHDYEEISGCFVTYTSDYYQTFKITAPHGEKLRGVYFSLNKRAYVFLTGHETEDDIIATCVHEDIHGAIDECFMSELEDSTHDDDMYGIYLDDIEEHNIIRYIKWIDENFGYSDADDVYMEKEFWKDLKKIKDPVKRKAFVNKHLPTIDPEIFYEDKIN